MVDKVPDGSKFCKKCGFAKPLDEFNSSKRYKSGKQSMCKEHEKEYRKNNKQKASDYHKFWRLGKREYELAYYQKNKEKIQAQKKIQRDKKRKENGE